MYLYKIQSTHLNGQTELSFGGSHYRRMSAPTCAHSLCMHSHAQSLWSGKCPYDPFYAEFLQIPYNNIDLASEDTECKS